MADTNMSYLYTIGGYATLFGLGYAVYHVSTQKNQKRATGANVRTTKPAQAESRKEDRKKKQRMESFTSEAQESSEKQAKAKTEPKASEASNSFLSNATDGNRDDGVDNLQFAKQLSKAKQGKQFSANADSGKKHKEKSIKQSQANKIGNAAEEKPSVQFEPSGNGADADDDESPAHSPVAETADASGVADMLEPARAGPSVLKLTDTEPKNEKKKKAAKVAEPVETKKQRQNRKKAEASRAAREDAEKERRVLEEKQRRAARIAEGRPARDGSQSTAAAPKNSAWNKGAPDAQTPKSSQTNGTHQLLDTLDAPASQPAKRSEAPKTEKTWISSLPSEEEQLEMLKDDADDWSTVTTKSSKKAAKKDVSAGSGDDTPPPSQPAPQPKQAAPTQSSNAPKPPKNFGAFSALSTKDDPAEEIEEEWDV